MANLQTNFMGLQLKNPIIVAAGPWSRDAASIQRSIDAGAAAVITESISMETSKNPSPRIYQGHSRQLFNTTLYSDISLEQWEREMASIDKRDACMIASIWGSTPSELAYLAKKAEHIGFDAVEISISAPLGTRTQVVGSYPAQLFEYLSAASKAVSVPVTVKLSYEAANAPAIAEIIDQSGIHGISAIDALKGLKGIDLSSKKAQMPTYGGYSGEYIRPIALATVATLTQLSDLPISGCGGIYNAENALEFLMLGACSVQLASVILQDGYSAIPRVLLEMNRWLNENGYNSLQDVIGLALNSLRSFEDIAPSPIKSKIDPLLCSMCGNCIHSCLYDALQLEGDHIVTLAERCTGCGYCAASCPKKAIELSW